MSPTDIITSIRKHERDSVKPTHQSQHPHPSFVSNMHFLDQSYFRIFFEITSTTKMWWWWLVVGGWWLVGGGGCCCNLAYTLVLDTKFQSVLSQFCHKFCDFEFQNSDFMMIYHNLDIKFRLL